MDIKKRAVLTHTDVWVDGSDCSQKILRDVTVRITANIKQEGVRVGYFEARKEIPDLMQKAH